MRTIYLLPFGGGSASNYRPYADAFPPDAGRLVPVELAGRGARQHEERARTLRECAALSLAQIDRDGDYVLHGHCMGALIAFEAIKLLEAEGAPLPGLAPKLLPKLLVVSGRNSPRHTNAWLSRVASLDDRALFDELLALGGVPAGLSFAMARPFLSVIRDDYAMYRGYDAGTDTIDVPILVLAGKDDHMTSKAELADWQRYTTRPLTVRWLDGGHYFILSNAGSAARHIAEFLEPVEAAGPDGERTNNDQQSARRDAA